MTWDGKPEVGKTYRSHGVEMYSQYALDERNDPTVEMWFFRNDEDDPSGGHGWLEVTIKEIVETQHCGTLVVYHRQWFNPEGEKLWGSKRKIGNLSSMRALFRRRKMTMVVDLPDGLTYRNGRIEFDCVSCGNASEWPVETELFELDDPMNLCGGSPRCCP